MPTKGKLQSLTNSKLQRDLLWNYLSLLVLASSGILINVIIAFFYGASALGSFNIVYAIYILFSQLCVGGVHYSVLNALAIKQQRRQRQVIISSGMLVTFSLSIIFASFVFSLRNILGHYLGGANIAFGIMLIAPGLFFFALNKVMMAALNGLRLMKAYAFSQIIRYGLMILSVFIIAITHLSYRWLPINFLIAECILSLYLLIIVAYRLCHLHFNTSLSWFKHHFSFGMRAFLVGVFVEINSRIDVLLLGVFVSHKLVGIYSFAAMLAEGLYQVLVVVQNNVNPIIAYHLANNDKYKLSCFIKKSWKYLYGGLLAILLPMLVLYVPLIHLLLPNRGLEQGWGVLLILCGGLYLVSGIIPFNNILTQGGAPGRQTLLNFLVVLTNTLLNLVLIPLLGILGAALATMLSSYLLGAAYLCYLIKVTFKFNPFSVTRGAQCVGENKHSDLSL